MNINVKVNKIKSQRYMGMHNLAKETLKVMGISIKNTYYKLNKQNNQLGCVFKCHEMSYDDPRRIKEFQHVSDSI